MTKEELREKRNRTIETLDDIKAVLGLDELYIAELEKKISVLLSCKNCPENKGGFICQKEYEDKCLAQKIQYIKELQQENAELKTRVENQKSFLERIRTKFKLGELDRKEIEGYLEGDQLTKAKEHIENLLYYVKQCTCERSNYAEIKEDIKEAEQFIEG